MSVNSTNLDFANLQSIVSENMRIRNVKMNTVKSENVHLDIPKVVDILWNSTNASLEASVSSTMMQLETEISTRK